MATSTLSHLLSPARETASSEHGARAAFALAKAAYERLQRHGGGSLAGGLAFGALLSIAPLLLIVVAIASVILGEETAAQRVLSAIGETLGPRGQELFGEWLVEARRWSAGATIVGVTLFLYGASRLVGIVDEAFEIVFEVPPRPKMRFWDTVKLYLRDQLQTVAVTLGAGLLLVVSLALRGVVAAILPSDGALAVLSTIAGELVSIGLWIGAMALAFEILPPVKLSRGDILLGATVSAVLVEVTLLVLRLLATQVDFGAAYGAAGAVAGVLVTFSILGQLFLFGAELTAERAHRRMGPPESRLTDRRTACMLKAERATAKGQPTSRETKPDGCRT